MLAQLYRRIDRTVVAVNRLLLIGALAAMSVIVAVAVFTRYLTDYSIPWSEEIARYLMIWMTFLGIGPIVRIGGHVAIETASEHLGAGAAKRLRGLVLLLSGVFCAILAWQGIAFAQRTVLQTTAVTEISFSWVSAAVPIGALLALWHLVAIAAMFLRHGTFERSADLESGEIAAG